MDKLIKNKNSDKLHTMTFAKGDNITSVKGNGKCNTGDTVTLAATFEDGYIFEGWYNGDTKVSSDNPYSFTVIEDVTLTAKGIDGRTIPLTLTANTAGSTVTLNSEAFESPEPWGNGYYSTDGETWTAYTLGTTLTLTNVGDKVYFKGTQTDYFDEGYVTNGGGYLYFTLTGSIAASGNCMSLWCGDNFATATALPYAGSGISLFGYNDALTSAPLLPATTLTENAYIGMFANCNSLTTPPALPATTLASRCYSQMFANCHGLTSVPALPATTLAYSCYYAMFEYCRNLIISDSSGTGYENAWRMPVDGVFTGVQYEQYEMVEGCATGGGRASGDMPGAVGSSYTYYTQNTPIS